jgi:hypothetical protein
MALEGEIPVGRSLAFDERPHLETRGVGDPPDLLAIE